MRLGMLVRSEDKGLGNQSWEAWRHLRPHATVIVVDGSNGAGTHPERYDIGTPVVVYDGRAIPAKARILEAFKDCTHVLSMETLYEWSLADDFRSMGIKSIVQLNPELYPHANNYGIPHADAWWNPTSWRQEHLPFKTRVVPVPVATDRWPVRNGGIVKTRPRLLHVVGKPALADRNGTQSFLESLKYLDDVDVTVTYQGPNSWSQPRLGTGSTIRFVVHAGPYWELYHGQDILVMPRRYGGLCLPVQEALAAGLVVVMSDCLPQSETWPIVPIPVHAGGPVHCLGGNVEAWDCDPVHIAIRIKQAIAHWPEYVDRGMHWVSGHSWDALLPLYEKEFDRLT